MKKTILTSFLLAASMALAQTSGTSSTPAASNPSSDTGSVQGCLSGSADNFTISDQSGKSWKLSGNTKDLSSHVGQLVAITGSAAPDGTTYKIDSVKMVSPSCPSTTSSADQSSTGTNAAAGAATGAATGAMTGAATSQAGETAQGAATTAQGAANTAQGAASTAQNAA